MRYAEEHKLKWDYPKFVIYIAGKTGCGKTRLARQIANLYTKGTELPYRNTTGTLTYFDTFKHQKVAILDDLRKSACAFVTLLDLLDRYPLDVQ
jgi:tRNA A37 threonylcarbamoyladenosine biosynthesis protein TsaE